MTTHFKKILTHKDSPQRLSEQESRNLDTEALYTDSMKVTTNPCQTMIGFGGAFTEATAYTLSRISEDLRTQVIESYFDTNKGLGYNIGRVHIHSCDFALGNYTYVKDNDESLESFDIAHDLELIVPLVKDAIAKRGSDIKLLASPWSPPAWMKTNNCMNQGGQLLPQYFDTWARYYIEFLKHYEAIGLPIWALTVQNEPAAVQTWDSCIYSAEEERDFIKNHLGPWLVKSGHEKVKLLIWDHNRDIMVERAQTVFDDPEAAKYVWGTGFHWYVSEAFENVGKVHELYPDKHLLFTEGCQEGGVKLGEWFTGERYARNMIGDFNNYCEGYLDWNLVLDEMGGPNHVGNYCDAPIIADTKENKLHYNSSYYYIGHFSKYVKAGAKRLETNFDLSEGLSAVAFENPDERIVLVVLNESDETKSFSAQVNEGYINDTLLAHSIATYIVM